MLKMDLVIVADTMDEWLEENTPIDPDICRYMGMLFLSLERWIRKFEQLL